MKTTLKHQTDAAIEELFNSLKTEQTFETLEEWIKKTKKMELQTIEYTLEDNDFSDFWSLFYWVEEITKYHKEKISIQECLYDFDSIEKQNTNEVYSFLIKYEPLLKNLSFSNNKIITGLNTKQYQDLMMFTELIEYKNALDLYLNISSKCTGFYYSKNKLNLDDVKLKVEIKEIQFYNYGST
uniref:hypothetical protein n=1 Tax=Flavobacterium sp. TaxID=239 RepID=UPI00404903BD